MCEGTDRGTVIEALEMVKEDYPEINIAQSKYGYRQVASHRADKDLSWALLNLLWFSVLDFLVKHNGLIIPWELLNFNVDANEDYSQLRTEEGWESTIDPCKWV